VNYVDIDAWWPMLSQHVTPGQLIDVFKDKPFRFEPGERWEYNNSGYVLLRRIIEQASGMPYGEFIRQRILAPLGMSSTYVYDAPGAIIPGRVAGYSAGAGGWVNAPYFSLTHGYAVGNMLSSVDDLARWDAASAREELLSAQAWKRANASFHLNDGSETGYAAGRYNGQVGPYASLEHGGNLMGGMTHMLRIPEKKLFIAVLANAEPAPVATPEELALQMAARVLGVNAEPAEVPLSVDQLDEYVGVYRINEQDTRSIQRRDQQLYSQHSSGPPFAIYPIGKDRFAFRDSMTQLIFERENGRVVAVSLTPRLHLPGPAARRMD
jgi:CubicO group peptidase (beta-lactamase class C family)